ncbi:hypothetical protein FACS1894204_12990 [Synergistales bacterium]|nr:hypothetical protein FACS1894204_12990 [Synergistales bacterium]
MLIVDKNFLKIDKTTTPKEIKAAIKSGAVDVNAIYDDDEGTTALMHAAIHSNNPKTLSTLIKNGADANAEDENNWTALMYAITYSNNPKILSTLLKNGADADVMDIQGNTALDFAIMMEKLEIALVLIKYGAYMSLADIKTLIPFIQKVENENSGYIADLIDKVAGYQVGL